MTQPLKPCGDCRACCEGWLADSRLDMYPGKVCKNLGCDGCEVYDDRPADPCRNFNCLWRSSEFLTEDLRPDRSGAIVVANKLLDWPVVQVVPTVTEKVPEDVLHRAMLLAAGAAVPVIEVTREDTGEEVIMLQTVYGPPAFLEATQNLELPETISLATAADAAGDTAMRIINGA